MFCANCGKEVLNNDKFCPFCGQSLHKKVVLDFSNLNNDSIIKRAFMLLEDGRFEESDEYFNASLDIDPENYQPYLGKLMIENKKNRVDDLFDYYNNKYNLVESINKEYIPTENELEYIRNQVEKYYIKNYLEKNEIAKLFNSNITYESTLQSRSIQKRMIEDEFNNNRFIERIKQFDKEKKIANRFNSVLKEYDKRIKESKKEEKKNNDEAKKEYNSFIEKADLELIELSKKAEEKREKDYQSLMIRYNSSDSVESLQNGLITLEELGDYKESKEYLEKYKERINSLLTQRNENKKRIVKIVLLSLLGIVISLCAYYLVIRPSLQYNDAKKSVESGDYKKAIDIYDSLGDYKDSNELLINAWYLKGKQELDEKNYQSAIESFQVTSNYLNSDELLRESIYLFGLQNISNKKYEEAIQLLSRIDGYKDSSEKIVEAKYEKAWELYNNEEYDEAIILYESIKEYSDVKDKISLVTYEKEINTETIPDFVGKEMHEIIYELSGMNISYSVVEKESSDYKAGVIIKTSPSAGAVVKNGSDVEVEISVGSNSNSSNSYGNHNSIPLYQIQLKDVTVNIRKTPKVDKNNWVGTASRFEVYNVYEVIRKEGYIWYRVANNRWIANDGSWIEVKND